MSRNHRVPTLLTILGGLDLMSFVLEDLLKGRPNPAFVVDYEQSRHQALTSRVTGASRLHATIYRLIEDWFGSSQNETVTLHVDSGNSLRNPEVENRPCAGVTGRLAAPREVPDEGLDRRRRKRHAVRPRRGHLVADEPAHLVDFALDLGIDRVGKEGE